MELEWNQMIVRLEKYFEIKLHSADNFDLFGLVPLRLSDDGSACVRDSDVSPKLLAINQDFIYMLSKSEIFALCDYLAPWNLVF